MGVLYIIATPIGNLEDITIRAIKLLLKTPVIACEDTRRTGQLIKILRERYPNFFNTLGENTDQKEFVSIRDWNEVKVVDQILETLSVSDVALVSDAGTPLLSDPGYKLVREARSRGFKIVPIPGPFAGAAAISVAGLPTNKIMFWGFLPKHWYLDSGMSHVIYESPTRTSKTCEEIKKRYPEAKILLARELTKIHENIEEWQGQKIVGEVIILVYIEPIRPAVKRTANYDQS